MSTFSSKLKSKVKGEDEGEKILTPRILERNRREAGASGFSKETAELITGLMTSDANSVRHSRFGASSRGDCMRRQMFSYLGHSQHISEDLSAIFGDGHWRHLRWQAMGYEEGWFTRVEVPFTIPEYGVSISMDAINDDEGWGFELKGTSQLAAIKNTGVPHKHLLQIHTMMLASGVDTFVYLAEDKRNQSFHEIVVRRDPKLMQEVEHELVLLAQAAADEVMPDILPECLGRTGATYRACPFRTVCHEATEWPDTRVALRSAS